MPIQIFRVKGPKEVQYMGFSFQEVRNMGFSFQIEKTLGEFKLSLKAESQGNRLGILGASGCGKSLRR